MQLIKGHTEAFCDLRLRRRTMQLTLERGVGPFNLTRLVPNRPWNPVNGAQFVDNCAPDTGDRIGLELDRPTDVELLNGVDEPEDAVGHQIGLLDVRRQTHADTTGHVLHQGRVMKDQALAGALVCRGLEFLPERPQGSLIGRHGILRGHRVDELTAVGSHPGSLPALPLERRSGPRMGLAIAGAQTIHRNMRVELRSGERSVTKQLLYATKVRAAVQKMRCRAVPKPVRPQGGNSL